MKRINPTVEMTQSPEPSSGSPRVEDYDPVDEREKLRMLTKLFALYPKQQDTEYRLESYVEELQGIPWRWVSRGLARITNERDRRWCPSISEVKRAIADEVLAARRRTDPGLIASLAGGASGEGQLKWLRGEVVNALQRGVLPPGATISSQEVPAVESGWENPVEPLL